MNKIFTTSIVIILLLAASNRAFSQLCLTGTGTSLTATTTYTFNTTAEGFTGDFVWSSGGSGKLESSKMSAGTTKQLITPVLELPLGATSIAWGLDLAGNANVISYTVEAQYYSGGSLNKVSVCSGGSLSTTGSSLTFASLAPATIIGNKFQLVITFTSSSSGNAVLTVDNFKTNANIPLNILPVTFSYFNVKASTGGVLLTWLVETEINVNRYEVERSSNGKSYSKIGSVAAAGLSQYTFTDAAPSTGSNYYRIKAVDNDGKFKYSTVVLYKTGKNSRVVMRAFPMPAKNMITIQHSTITDASQISILSQDGKLVKSIVPSSGSQQTVVDLSTVKPGLYLLHFNNGSGELETMKLIKQ